MEYANCAAALIAGGGAKSMIDRFNTRYTPAQWLEIVKMARDLGFID